MRDEWFGDKRDLAKWSTLAHLAEAAKAGSIVQIAFYRPSERPDFLEGEDAASIPAEVWEAFRSLSQVRPGLEEALGVDVRIFDQEFDPADRDAYLRDCIRFILDSSQPRIVLLDPDTGLQPTKLTPQHISKSEVTEVWSHLSGGDFLVLYQHARRDRTWRDDVRSDFESLIGGQDSREFFSPSIAKDVTFFAARKH